MRRGRVLRIFIFLFCMWGAGGALIGLGVHALGRKAVPPKGEAFPLTDLPGVYFIGGSFFILVSLVLCFLVLGRTEDAAGRTPGTQRQKRKKKKRK